MENQKLLEIINNILINSDKPAVTEITDKSSLRDDIGLDSLDLAELTVNIEVESGVDIFESGLVSTIGEIKEKLANQ